MHQILDARLVIAALRMALAQRRPVKPLIIHSDRGAQFASAAYRQILAQHGLIASMARKGNCYDNAFIESFWSSLKYELVYHHRFATLAEARSAIFHYIETFYNRTRLHSSLDYQTPTHFESKQTRNYPSSLSEKTGQAQIPTPNDFASRQLAFVSGEGESLK
jgi:transposase InsO family protein